MKIKNFFIILFLSIVLLSSAQADIKPTYNFFFSSGKCRIWPIEAMHRTKIGIDEQGQAWVIYKSRLYRAYPEGLKKANYTIPEMPDQFIKSRDGRLYTVWRGKEGIGITVFSKSKIKKVAYLKEKIDMGWDTGICYTFFYVDSLNRIWVTSAGGFPGICCWTGNEWIKHKLNPKEFILDKYQKRENWSAIHFPPIRCAEISKGKMIFWTERKDDYSFTPRLDLFLAFYNGKFRHLPIPSLPRGAITALELGSDGLFWVAMAKEKGIFRINIKKNSVSRVIFPGHLFRNLQIVEIFRREKKIFILVHSEKSKHLSLWRIEGNKIKCEIETVEGNTDFWLYRSYFCPLVTTKNGLLLGTNTSGIWLKTKNGKGWRHMDWRSGFPCVAANEIKEDQNGNLWFCGWDRHKSHSDETLACMRLSATEKADEKRIVSNWKNIGIEYPIECYIFDKNNYLWAQLGKDAALIGQFRKGKWKTFSLKKDFCSWKHISLLEDDQGGVWVYNSHWEDSREGVAIFEEGKAFYFSSLESACESIAKRGEERLVYSESDYRNVHIKDGKVCLFHQLYYEEPLLHYFNGVNWRHWKIRDIDDRASYSSSFRPEFPFFDNKGELRVNIQGKGWLWDGERWKPASYFMGPFEVRRLEESLQVEREKEKKLRKRLEQLDKKFPRGKRLRRVVETNDGTIWAQTCFSLYKVVGDLWTEIDRGEHPLVADNIELLRVDGEGNLLVKSFRGWFVRVADSHPPETLIGSEPKTMEKFPFSVSFSGRDDKTPEENLKFSWSLDGGEWSSLSEEKRVSFDWLANGEYILRAKALDEELNYDPTPAVFQFTVKINFEKLLAEALEMLKSADHEERERAVKYLVRIGKEALPELRNARAATSDDDLRWWIDVAIQQIGLGK